jgi:hypothetical protein
MRVPVIESYGNHDIHNQTGDAVIKGIIARNSQSKMKRDFCPANPHSAWDWDVQLSIR